MGGKDRTKEQLLDELARLRLRVGELETLQAKHGEMAPASRCGDEGRFRKYFGLPHMGIAIVDAEGHWVEANDRLCSMLQYSRDELRSMTWQGLTPGDELRTDFEMLRSVLDGKKESSIFDKSFIRKDGSFLPVKVSASPVRNDDGDIDHFVASIDDITERKRLEGELKFTNALLSVQQEVSIDGILIVDESDRILLFNKRFRDMWGIAPEILEGQVDAPVLQSVCAKVKDPETFVRRVSHLYAHRSETSRDEIALTDGRTFDRYSSPMFGSDGTYYGRIWYFRDMTIRKQAEEVLQDAERRYRELADSLPQIVLELDEKGNVTFLNRNGFLVSRYTKEDFERGLNVFQMVIREDRAKLAGNIEKLFRGERLTGSEYTVERKDGSTFPAEVHSNPIVRQNSVVGYRAIVVDIADRKRTEEALRESREKYRELVEYANSIILRMDSAGVVTFFNEFAQSFFGYTEEEILGKSVIGTIVPPQDSSGLDLKRLIADIGRNPNHYPTNINENMRRDGERVWIAWTNRPVFDKQGRVTDILCIGNDITAEKKATEALEEREEILKAIINGSPVPKLVIDGNHRVMYWNKALEDLTGVSGEEMIGTDGHSKVFYRGERPCLADLVVDDKAEDISSRGWPGKPVRSSVVRGAYEATDLIRIPGKEEKWLHSTAAQIRDLKGSIIGAIETLEDITERTHTLRILKKREQDLESKSINLEEAYTALKVLLQHKDRDKQTLEDTIIANVRELVFPYLDKLESTRPSEGQKAYINIVRSHLNDIISPFLQRMSAIHSQLTPTELQVAVLIRAGRSNKEIAEMLNIGTGTVETHRKSIRIKLGLNKKKVNLHSYLCSLK